MICQTLRICLATVISHQNKTITDLRQSTEIYRNKVDGNIPMGIVESSDSILPNAQIGSAVSPSRKPAQWCSRAKDPEGKPQQ